MIEIARRDAEEAGLADQISFESGDGENLRLEDNSFDMVVSTGSFGSWKNPVKVLNECYRVLKQDGEAWTIDFRQDLSKEEIKML